MPASNPAAYGDPMGYLDPAAQAQLLGTAMHPAAAVDQGAGAGLLGALLSTLGDAAPQARPFAPDDFDLLDVRQGLRTPQWLAEKHGVPLETVLDAYPEFHQFGKGSRQGAAKEQRQPQRNQGRGMTLIEALQTRPQK